MINSLLSQLYGDELGNQTAEITYLAATLHQGSCLLCTMQHSQGSPLPMCVPVDKPLTIKKGPDTLRVKTREINDLVTFICHIDTDEQMRVDWALIELYFVSDTGLDASGIPTITTVQNRGWMVIEGHGAGYHQYANQAMSFQ